MLISLHIPKTAGESFRKALGDHFQENLIQIYSESPLKRPVLKRNLEVNYWGAVNATKKFDSSLCIHGHFSLGKYRWLRFRNPDVKYVTWFRDPVERLASQYFFMKKIYGTLESPSKFHRTVIEENWSFEEFCFNPGLRNFCHQYLQGFPIEHFDFIGVTEFYEEDFQYFAEKIIGRPLPIYYENMNSARQTKAYEIEPQLREKIAAYHALDMQLYCQVLDMRRSRN